MSQPLEIPETQMYDKSGGGDGSSPTAEIKTANDLISLLLEIMEVWVQLVERDPAESHLWSDDDTQTLSWIEVYQQEYLKMRHYILELEKIVRKISERETEKEKMKANKMDLESMERRAEETELEKNEGKTRMARLEIRIKEIELETIEMNLREKELGEMRKRIRELKESWE